MSWYVSHIVGEPVAARLTSKRSPSSTSPLWFASTNRSDPFREMPAARELISSTIGNSEYAPSAPRYCSPPKSIQRAKESMGAPAGRNGSDPWSGRDLSNVAGRGWREDGAPISGQLQSDAASFFLVPSLVEERPAGTQLPEFDDPPV